MCVENLRKQLEKVEAQMRENKRQAVEQKMTRFWLMGKWAGLTELPEDRLADAFRNIRLWVVAMRTAPPMPLPDTSDSSPLLAFQVGAECLGYHDGDPVKATNGYPIHRGEIVLEYLRREIEAEEIDPLVKSRLLCKIVNLGIDLNPV